MAETDKKPLAEAVEEAAGEKLGIQRWDRPAIFRDAAGAATDADLPYWLVLLLSGAIATLGLALNSSAVIIGAMLIAPLLAPVLGLALALAAGDGRLAFQTALVVLASTVAVVFAAALLTLALPFQTITDEVLARTRPTTLDLVIAVLSGLAGVVVTVARGHRLSAAIPGVAISVALIPPLGVAGFGIGSGWNWQLIQGSLLLYGANLAGIVLSGMLVFMLVGMHRPDVLNAARKWHTAGETTGLVKWTDRIRWVRQLGVIESMWARVGLVLVFVAAVVVPLSRSLEQITREARIRSAVAAIAEDIFDVEDRSSIISKRVVSGPKSTQVYLRVATAEWFGRGARERFERLASRRAAEPIGLVLEQLPASRGDVDDLAKMLPGSNPPAAAPAPPVAVGLPDLLMPVREQLQEAAGEVILPDGAALLDAELVLDSRSPATAQLVYGSAARLPLQAEQILARQFRRALGPAELHVRVRYVALAPQPLGANETLPNATGLLQRYPRLRAEITGTPGDTTAVPAAVDRLVRAGIDRTRIRTRTALDAEPQVQLQAATEE